MGYIYFISSNSVTEIVMMNFMHFLGQNLNPIWPPGGHVEFIVIATPPDPQQMQTHNQVQCIWLGLKLCLNEIHDLDSSKMAARPAILKLAFQTKYVISRPGINITSNGNHFISSN